MIEKVGPSMEKPKHVEDRTFLNLVLWLVSN